MDEDDNIASFHGKLTDISNQASLLGKPFDESIFIRKTLRSLPIRFVRSLLCYEGQIPSPQWCWDLSRGPQRRWPPQWKSSPPIWLLYHPPH